MFAIVSAFLSYLSSLFRPKHELALEILPLRHQIFVLKRQTPRPKLRRLDRCLCQQDPTHWSELASGRQYSWASSAPHLSRSDLRISVTARYDQLRLVGLFLSAAGPVWCRTVTFRSQ